MRSDSYPLTVKTGGNEVIASGIVHLDSPRVSFKLANLKIAFKFTNDKEEKRYTGEVIGDELVITLFNFNNSLGEGLIKPVEIGTLDSRPLLVTCYVKTMESDLREFSYTFMLRGD